MHYPINFVVKHPDFFVKEARPQAVETYQLAAQLAGRVSLLPDRHPYAEETIWKHRIETGGADRDRTDDPLLAKQVLSQLSYSPFQVLWLRWWAWVDSNYRPHPYQGCALTN
jgi:hypothetical protein